jgi:hypothetical protein
MMFILAGGGGDPTETIVRVAFLGNASVNTHYICVTTSSPPSPRWSIRPVPGTARGETRSVGDGVS